MSLAEIFSPMIILGIFVAGGLGSVVRVLLSKFNGFWPWGILLANVVASFFAGWAVTSFAEDVTWVAILVVGLAGGLSTFSSWAAGAVQLVAKDRPLAATLYTVVTVIFSSTAAWVGLLLGSTLIY
jgi:CrcB protein